jgi:hypothetical protein
MTEKCIFCNARYWKEECTTEGLYTDCCNNGSIRLPPFSEPPPYIKSLLWHDPTHIADANLFYKKARVFNSQCSFASTSMTRSPLFDVRRGIPTLLITGNIYNKIGTF